MDFFGGMPAGGYAPNAASIGSGGGQPGFWGGAMDKLGGAWDATKASPWVKDPNNLAMLLGGAGQAFSAGHPNSWQSQLGGLAAGMGKSGKVAEAGSKVSQQQDMLADALAALGGGMTPAGMKGGTSFKMGKNGDFSITGDYGADVDQGPFSTKSELEPTNMIPQVSDTNALQNFSQGSTGLSAQDLLGLSSQEVNALLTQQLAGGAQGLDIAKMKNDMGNDAFSRENTLYERNKPQPGKVIEGKDFQWVVDPITGVGKKTNVPIYRAPGKVTGDDPKKTVSWDKSGKSHEDWVRPSEYGKFKSDVEKQGGRTGEAPGQIRENEMVSIKAMNMAFSELATDEEKENAVGIYNSTVPDKATTMLEWDTVRLNEVKKIKLPVINKIQMTAGHVRRVIKVNPGISIKEAIRLITEANKK